MIIISVYKIPQTTLFVKCFFRIPGKIFMRSNGGRSVCSGRQGGVKRPVWLVSRQAGKHGGKNKKWKKRLWNGAFAAGQIFIIWSTFIIQYKCYTSVRGNLVLIKKQAELLQSSDISKIPLRNGGKSGAAHAAPPIPYGYSIALMRSTSDCLRQ